MKSWAEKEHHPLPLVIDTMPGRDLRETYIDRRLHKGWAGFHNSETCSPFRKRQKWEFPY